MAPPINVDAVNAINIAALPYSNIQDVFDAGTTYNVWYKYTAVANENVIGIWGFGNLVGYKPTLTVWTGPDTAPVPYLPTFQIFSQNKPVQFPVSPGVTYYFKFTKNGDFATSLLTVNALTAPSVNAPLGSIIIPDDTEGFPATLISSIDADDYNILRYLSPFPASEAADALNTGQVLAADAWNGNVQFFNPDLSYLGPTVASTVGFGPGIRAQNTLGRFYVGSESNPPIVTVFSAAGALLETHTITAHVGMTGLGANNAGTILYHGKSGANQPVKKWDLVGDTDLGILLAAIPNYVTAFDILTLADDTLLISKVQLAGGEFSVLRVDSAGTILNSYLITNVNVLPAFTLPRLAYAPDGTSFWVWFHLAGGISRFHNIRISDGVVLRQIQHVEYEQGTYQGTETATPLARFGLSFSCPFFIIRAASGGGGGNPGTIQVIKNTIPAGSSQVFPFVAGGGLSPTSFNLTDTQMQQYNNVPIGSGYSIEETVPAGWSVVYVVSNGSPINNISVADSELVVVTVTNTRLPNNRSGIYKIVPGKRQDTLWNNLADRSTTDVKKPNPFIKTGYLGE